MVTTFKSYFGDYLNGLFVTWESTPNASGGTSDISITMNMHLRSKLYVYGLKQADSARYGTGGSMTYTPD